MLTETKSTTVIIITMSTDKIPFLRLMQALDPLFPIGAFTLSNGLETYVQKDIVRDKKSLSEYLRAYLHALPTGDAGFAARAALGDDPAYLDELFAAARSPYELRNGSRNLCRRFIKTEAKMGSCPLLEKYGRDIMTGTPDGCHPVAVGLFIRDIGADVYSSISMYCYSLLSATVNHAAKLIPLSQLDGQAALAEIIEHIPEAAQLAMAVRTDELGIGGPGFDLRSMEHEKLYSRIYIS